MTILITGGAGYIGSHVARLLTSSGNDVVLIDDMSTGLASRVQGQELIEIDLSSSAAVDRLEEVFSNKSIDSVIHFAARKKVGESVELPEWYYQQNVGGLANLLQAMKNSGVRNLVFSSSAAVYGMPNIGLVNEECDCKPINPYGETKLVGEWLVKAAANSWGLSATNLRYFNVAGTGWNDLADTQIANLVPIAIQAINTGSNPVVFGDDYETNDGSCIRDYIHVLDLAEAHVAALQRQPDKPGQVHTYNVGTGRGSSVFEVLNQLREISGKAFAIDVKGRRAGDPPSLTADVSKIENELGWKARFGLSEIIASAWQASTT